MVKIYNTLTEKQVALKSRSKLNMFVCGPTVYDHAHLGHARVEVVFDTLTRFLRKAGYKVFYLSNITDIDDKIIERNANVKLLTKSYLEDMKGLGVLSVDKRAAASDHIKEIIDQIRKLEKKGFTYKTSSGIYFKVKKFKDYGKLSKQNLEELRPGWRIEPDTEKKDPLDFALWKFPKTENEPRWPSPWGEGRPGWHIEDTAITEKFFGPQYDIHGGGLDLKFPHHESEIAQQETASGKKPFVKIWMHVGFLMINEEKMAKSLNNFVAIKDFLKKYSSDVLRLMILSHHYRSPINYTDDLIKQHQSAWEKIDKYLHTLKPSTHSESDANLRMNEKNKEFIEALSDDFNTPRALGILFSFMMTASKNNKNKKWLVERFNMLGFRLKIPKISKELVNLLNKREQLRKVKKFSESDKIREKINSLGFEIED